MTRVPSTARRRIVARLASFAVAGLLAGQGGLAAAAAASPNDIVLGQTYDASNAELRTIARVQQAYFDHVNASGGVRGRQIRLVSLDDQGDLQVARKNLLDLADRHQALTLFGMPGVMPNEAGVLPQLFVRDRAWTTASDAQPGVATVGFLPGYALEGMLIARHLIERTPAPRIAVLLGGEAADEQLLEGLRNGLGADAPVLFAKVQPAGANVDAMEASLRTLQASGANVLVIAASSALTIRTLGMAQDQAWHPQRIISSDSAQALRTASPAVREKTVGVESIRYFKDGHDPAWSTLKLFQFAEFPRWDNDSGIQVYSRFIKRYAADADTKSEPAQYAYSTAKLMVQVLVQCRDRLTRGNIAKQALRLSVSDVPLLSPGIRVYTHPTRSTPITQGQFMRFDGTWWSEFGDVLDVDE